MCCWNGRKSTINLNVNSSGWFCTELHELSKRYLLGRLIPELQWLWIMVMGQPLHWPPQSLQVLPLIFASWVWLWDSESSKYIYGNPENSLSASWFVFPFDCPKFWILPYQIETEQPWPRVLPSRFFFFRRQISPIFQDYVVRFPHQPTPWRNSNPFRSWPGLR